MREIFISAVGMKVPVVGFGCSALTGSSRKTAERLLATAYDNGMRHFDVARYYGYGDAEGILGEFLKTKRSQVTITTKFGIQPPARTSALGFAVRIARRVLRVLPSARRVAQRSAPSIVKGGAFSAADAQASLDTSLRELRTDHVDFYLLHDYTVGDQPVDELLAFLEAIVRAGKIRCFGIGTDIGNVLLALQRQPKLCSVLQFQNSVLTQNLARFLPGTMSGRFVITHGAVGHSSSVVSSFLLAHREKSKEWSEKIGADCSRPETISALLLNYAAEVNSQGLVLFSSTKPETVARNVRAVLQPEFSAAQIKIFAQLVQEDLSPQRTS